MVLTVFHILYITSPWFIYFVAGILCLLISSTYLPPPSHSPPPWQSPVWFLYLVLFVHLLYFLDSKYMWNHMIFVFLCLNYVSVIYSTHYPTMLSQITKYLSFFWLIFLCVCVCVCVCVCNFSIHSSIDEHLSCYHMLDIINNELSNHKSFWISVFVLFQ